MIEGTVRSGCGRASKAFLNPSLDRMAQIHAVTGWWPYPGTLNVSVDDLTAAIQSLGPPEAAIDPTNRLGPLRMWYVGLRATASSSSLPVVIVRHDRSRTQYLEIVASSRLRTFLKDGDRLILTRPAR